MVKKRLLNIVRINFVLTFILLDKNWTSIEYRKKT